MEGEGTFPEVLDSRAGGTGIELDFEVLVVPATSTGGLLALASSWSEDGLLGFLDGCSFAEGFDAGFAVAGKPPPPPPPPPPVVLFPAAGRRTGLPSESAMFKVCLTFGAPDMERHFTSPMCVPSTYLFPRAS